MPDISMCFNEDCPSNVLCYRYMAIPNEWRQAYMAYQVEDGEEKCNSFLEIYLDDQVKGLPRKDS